MDFDKEKLMQLFRKKCELKKIKFKGMDGIFPDDIEDTLLPYWNQELGRLLNPLPDLNVVLKELKTRLKFLESS